MTSSKTDLIGRLLKCLFCSGLLLSFALLLQNCNGSEEEINPTTPNPNPPVNPPQVQFDGFNLDFQTGDYWEFYWIRESEIVSGSDVRASSESGNFRITLGSSRVIDGITTFEVDITGENLENYGGPDWDYLAASENTILGSTTGDSLEIIFDAQVGEWFGGGFFRQFDKTARITTRSASIENEFVATTNAVIVEYKDGESFCESIDGIRICSGEEQFTLNVADYYKAGIGPLGYNFFYTVLDGGGGVNTLTRNTLEIGLVATSFNADDGFEPMLPPWLKKASMPRFVQDAATVVLNDQIILFGGRNANFQPVSTSLVYDPLADNWTEGPSVIYNVFQRAYSFGDKVFFPHSELADRMVVYDLADDSWSEGTPYPGLLAGSDFYSTSLGEFIFFFPVRSVVPADVVAYSLATDQWFNGTPSPWTFDEMAAINTVNDKIIISGGFKSGDFLTSVHTYDLSVEFNSPNAWNKISGVLDEGRAGHRSESVGDKLYVMGGDNYGPVIRAVETYDPETGSANTVSSMIDAREYFMSAVWNGKIYVIGGFDGDPLVSVEEYDPTKDRRNQ